MTNSVSDDNHSYVESKMCRTVHATRVHLYVIRNFNFFLVKPQFLFIVLKYLQLILHNFRILIYHFMKNKDGIR